MRRVGVAALVVAGSLAGCTTPHGERAKLVRAPDRCTDQTVQIYFEAWSADLTQEGRMVIDAAATGVRACKITGVDVVGLADAAGSPQANLELSRKRAEAVSKALGAAGLPVPGYDIAAHGSAGAVTLQGQDRPLRRRVDVTLHVTNP